MTAKQLLAVLNDPKQELSWDECWDMINSKGLELEFSVDDLIEALQGKTELVRILAIRKLSELKIERSFWSNQLCSLLVDHDDLVRAEALKAAKHFLPSSKEIRSSLQAMRDRRTEHLGLRIKAAWYLIKMQTGPRIGNSAEQN